MGQKFSICPQNRYFMEDDSLEIIEPQEPNSGLPQGKFLNRHKVRGFLSTLFFKHREG